MKFKLFKRNNPVRIRVSGLLVKDDTLLLVAHRKDDEIYWLLPGGGVQYGESLVQALKREFREEIGINIDVNRLALLCDSIEPGGKRHILNVSFTCTFLEGRYNLGVDKRLHEFGFFDKHDIANLRLYPPINRTLVSILEKKKHDIYLGSLWMV